ncbi:MAG: hypothetical protein U5O16_25985 [Rhodococcus sp. (in: high G+C Gram-positive bacteria)]|uniref:hypothetical protein n=1 Tax=Rhodococcus sp. TaxID=1831 RepID=UPI002AD7A449|nr:hypothetical protein [Rhodococcus sp. (in: high G+C Gram-positive bacteria)]
MTTFEPPRSPDDDSSSSILDIFREVRTRANQGIREVTQLSVAEDSLVAADDAVMTAKSYRESVSLLLLSAYDHLHLTAVSVVTLRGVLPFATATPIRTSITVASTALWLLGKSADDRRLRMIQYWLLDNRRMMEFVENGHPSGVGGEIRRNRDTAIAEVEAKRARFLADATALKFSESKMKTTTSDTKMVSEAGEWLSSEGFDGFDPKIEVARQWRLLSGHAHGFRWPHAASETITNVDEGKWGHLTFLADEGDMLSSALIALRLTDAAWARFQELAAAPKNL